LARKKRPAEHANHERWLVSYADFITLLFAFFVVMFASSQTDKAKAQQVSKSVSEALQKGGFAAAVHEILGGTINETGKGNAMMKGPGGTNAKNVPDTSQPALAELVPSMQFLTKELKKEIDQGKVDVHLEPRGLVVSLRQATFFPSGEDTVDPNTYSTIDKLAETIKELPNAIRLEGHTDSIPIHTAKFRSNWELSAARSIAMLQLFADRYAIPRPRMAIAGYADTIPIDDNTTAEGRAHNRRVDVVILNQRVAMDSEPKSSQEPQAKPNPQPPPKQATSKK
jgi:chemotaxis protein MotB